MRRVLKVLQYLVLLIVVLVLVAGIGGYTYVRRSLPQHAGVVKLQGVAAPIEIIRDVDAIPHIYAQSKTDALFGLGYVHAQDRLWQLEMQRRIGQGRLAEILGEAAVPSDRLLRTVGVYRAAQQSWESTPDETRRLISAYTDGINAFIATRSASQYPPEFTIVQATAEPWTGADVLAWQKMMAWNLGGDLWLELRDHEIVQTVGPDRAKELLPAYPDDGLNIVETLPPGSNTAARPAPLPHAVDTRAPSSQRESYRRLAKLWMDVQTIVGVSGQDGAGIGSNNWVVDGSKSTTGKPILANDPHLGMNIPSIWYLAHLSAGDFDTIGATIPGLPAVVTGRNRSIAWGVTNLNPDVQDLFRERIDASGQMAEFQGQMEPMQLITETIAIKGQLPVEQPVRITRHGPLISDAINADDALLPESERSEPLEPLAFRWTALEPEDKTVGAFLQINTAQNWDEFKDALRGYLAPAQNFVYADVAGNIGYYAPGRMPIRATGTNSMPAEGWSGTQEWTGWVPFESLPQAYNPPEHLLVTANNRPLPAQYQYQLGQRWITPYRAQRIRDLLEAKPQLSPDDFAAIQGDTVSLLAHELLPKLLPLVTPQNDSERQALALLQSWDGDAKGESVAATLFAGWLQQLPLAIAGDELGTDLLDDYKWYIETEVGRFLVNTIQQSDSPWCDVTTTKSNEDCSDIATQTFQVALADLRGRLGADMDAWRWDSVHETAFLHQPFSGVPVLGDLFSRRAANGGDWSTINNGPYGFDSFDQESGPGYRQIIDLSCLDCGRFILATGQSGHILSAHYDDYISDWQKLRYRPMRFERQTVEQDRHTTLRLEPE